MRGKKAKIRKIEADGEYKSTLIAKMINKVMRDGKKILAKKIVYNAIKNATQKLKDVKPEELIEKVVENVKPKLEVRSRRVGGVNYQVPGPVSEQRQIHLALKWLIDGARERRKKEAFYIALSEELVDAYKKSGYAYKKKEDMHKMAEANKAFAHFQW